MDGEFAILIGTRVMDDRRSGRLFLEATRASAFVLNFHFAFWAFEIACQVVGNCKRVSHRKGKQEQQKRGKNAFHDRGLIHSRNAQQGVN